MSAPLAVALAAIMLAAAAPAASAASAWHPRPPAVAARAAAFGPVRPVPLARPPAPPRPPVLARRWGGRQSLAGICTPIGPCVGPDGSVYYVTPSGQVRYLPR